MHFLLASIAFVLWAGYIIYSYAVGNGLGIAHSEEITQLLRSYLGMGGSGVPLNPGQLAVLGKCFQYIVIVLIIYGIYKFLQVWLQGAKVKITFWHIIGGALVQICILSFFFFNLPEVINNTRPEVIRAGGLALFSGICTLLLFPFFLTLLSRSLGFSVLFRLFSAFRSPHWREEDIRLRLPTETALGYGIISLLILALGLLGSYNLVSVLSLLALLAVVSYEGWIETWRDIRTRFISFEGHDLSKSGFIATFAPKLVSAEIIYLFITFLFGVSLISIYRPMPIGWDDLGVYMNYPKIMAMSESILSGAGMYMWQLMTSVGFLFNNSAPQAFFINQVGGILSVLAITLGASLLFEEKGKKSLIALPILFAGLFYSMPMIVFQQAKDMKLDPALMFFTVTTITLLMVVLRRIGGRDSEILDGRKRVSTIGLMILMAILIGFAFSLKVTTLMLILATFAVLCFRLFGYGGYIGFFFLFIAFFTQFHLWDQLNVVYPKNDPLWIQNVFILFTSLAIVSFGIGVFRHGFRMSRLGILACMLALAIPLMPWVGKNFFESRSLSIPSLLGGSGGTFTPDFTRIHTAESIKNIQDKTVSAISASGQASNEDLGRYFGYEKGINNYLKLPTNLTFQKNQSGEYTDITFFYFALLPVLLLFIPSRGQRFAIFIGLILLGLILYYFIPSTSTYITALFATQDLPNGYLWIFGLFILGTLTPAKLLSPTERNKDFQDITLFTAFYGVIFAISAYGIVWYGIAIYYGFLLMIGLASLSFTHYDDEDMKNEYVMGGKTLVTSVLFFITLIHFLFYAGPHGWSNYRASYFPDFKANKVGQETSIFESHADYLLPIATMNLKDPMTAVNAGKTVAQTAVMKSFFQSGVDSVDTMNRFINWVKYGGKITDVGVIRDVENVAQTFYSHILYPPREEINTGKIYRIGTFMTYFIAQNRARYLDDSLVITFPAYFYDPVPEVATNRMKTLGIEYLLVDLNAATIDRDPRHDLTTRMENLLGTFTAKNLTLVSTDSICLQLGLDQYRRGGINREQFVALAGVNSESYDANNVMIPRGKKLNDCYNEIIKVMTTEDINTKYPYLVPLATTITEQKAAQDKNKLGAIFSQYVRPGYFALFTISDTIPPSLIQTAPNAGTGVITSSGSNAQSGSVTLTGSV